jgi:hypothetical protein
LLLHGALGVRIPQAKEGMGRALGVNVMSNRPKIEVGTRKRAKPQTLAKAQQGDCTEVRSGRLAANDPTTTVQVNAAGFACR